MTLRLALVLGVVAAGLAGGTMWWGARADDSRLNLDAVFRCTATDAAGKQTCAEGRELILQSCTACHTFVPIVMQQFDGNGWQGLFDRHRPRVPELSNEQVATIQRYLTQNFNPDTPPPELPAELLKNWTSY